jgi:hypothetical protein
MSDDELIDRALAPAAIRAAAKRGELAAQVLLVLGDGLDLVAFGKSGVAALA